MNGVLVGDIRLRQKCDHLRQYIFKTLGIICAKKKYMRFPLFTLAELVIF
jgi:hypothetical protein